MKRRRSILQVIKLKDNRKKELEIEIKYALDRLDEEESRLQSLNNDYNDTMARFEQRTVDGNLDPANVTAYYEYFAAMRDRIAHQKVLREQRRIELDAVKSALVTAHKEKKALEILDAKTLKREKVRRERNEQNDADFHTIARRMK